MSVEGLFGIMRSLPSRNSNEQPNVTGTLSAGRTISQGSGWASQLSGRSSCQPF